MGPESARITIIVIDDVGWELLDRAVAPHIGALMTRGMVFTEAWAYPTCTSARAGLLTGRHATRTGVGSLLSSPDEPGLLHDEITLAEALQEPVHFIGKWHVSNPRCQGSCRPQPPGPSASCTGGAARSLPLAG